MGIVGTKKLVAYNTGNTYQAALARHRRSIGEKAVCLDLGGIVDEGFLAETPRYKNMFQRNRHFVPMTMEHVTGLLEVLVAYPSNRADKDIDAEIIVGLNPTAFWKHEVESIPFTMNQPCWGHMHYVPHADCDSSNQSVANRKHAITLVQMLAGTPGTSLEEIAEAMVEALREQICLLLGMVDKHLDGDLSLAACGLDSLSAIELRDWMCKVVNVDIPIFRILENASLQSMGMAVAEVLYQRLSSG